MSGRLTFRSIGDRGERYPAWLTSLRDKSGAYVIRDAFTREVLYVGESHTGRLYQTITRHFQVWARAKGFWAGIFGSDNDPGVTYARASCVVAVLVTSAADAREIQNDLIGYHDPRDNMHHTKRAPASDDDAPF